MDKKSIDNLKRAGEIAKKTVEFSKIIVKPKMNLVELAEKIEKKILELGGKPAFPVNLSINEVAAHSTPSHNSRDIARGLLKIDIGVHIDGHIADTAFSVDLENSELNKNLILAAECGLISAEKIVKFGTPLADIGKAISNAIREKGFVPIVNLSGHLIEKWNIHAGTTIPNYDNSSSENIKEGIYAIEPFSTNGYGSVKDGQPSGIFQITEQKNVRDSFSRKVLSFILEEYNGLPFCSRWLYNKFGSRGLLALRYMNETGILYEYPQLVESGKGIVAQAEHSFIVTKSEVIVTTK